MSKIFHTCYYINLNRSHDRRRKMNRIYKGLKRVPAIDGNNLKNSTTMSKYQIACLQSHIKAIRLAHENGDNGALIMEDDVYIDYSYLWNKNIQQIINNRPSDAECVILHCSNLKECKKMVKMGNDFSKWKKGRFSTGCYYITKNGIKKIYDNYKSNFIPKSFNPADHFLYNVLKSYNYTKPLFNIKMNYSLVRNKNRFNKKYELENIKLFKIYYKKIIRRKIINLRKNLRKLIRKMLKIKNQKKNKKIRIQIRKLKSSKNILSKKMRRR